MIVSIQMNDIYTKRTASLEAVLFSCLKYSLFYLIFDIKIFTKSQSEQIFLQGIKAKAHYMEKCAEFIDLLILSLDLPYLLYTLEFV